MKRFFKENWLVIVTGVVVGLAALLLQALGNPKNMGFCIACFERDIAGALGLHSAAVVQYVRPEVIGIVLGSCIMALIGKEFRAQAGSSPATRFAVGALVMIGALVFLGCPFVCCCVWAAATSTPSWAFWASSSVPLSAPCS